MRPLRPLSYAEAAALSRDPLSRERFGPGAAPCLLLDLTSDAPPEESLARWVQDLPTPVIGVGEESALGMLCDTICADLPEAARLASNIEAAPLAAMVLVQVLRATAALPLPAALATESLGYATLQSGPEFRVWLAAHPGQGQPPQVKAEPLLLRRNGDTLALTLNRPAARNAIDRALRDALIEAFALGALDDSITHITLRGAGKCFSVGGDLAEFGQAPDSATAHAIRSLRLPARAAANCAAKLHVHVHGACIGAGVEIAAFAHRVTAAPKTFFHLPELRYGLIPGAGGCVGIARRIGRHRTAWLVLSGARITARQALAWGLIDGIVFDGDHAS